MIFDFDLVKIGVFVVDMVFFCVLCATLPLMVEFCLMTSKICYNDLFYQTNITMKFIKTALFIATLSALVGCNQDSNAKIKSDNNPQSSSDKAPLHNSTAQNSDPNHQPDIAKALQDNLNKSGIDVHVTSVVPTQMPQMYWATIDGASPVFVDKTGSYIIDGTIVELGGERPVDIAVKIRSAAAKTALTRVDGSQMIVFPAKGETKAAIYAFTDPTCGYCQKLHEEISDINAGGIEVRYLAWPRGDKPLPLAEAIWCSKDRKDALGRAKKGENIDAPACDNPVKTHVALGYSLGVTGTPAIFAENGVQLGGYLPSAELVKSAIANKN